MEFTDQPLEPIGRVLLHQTIENNLGYKTPLVFRIVKLLQKSGYLPLYGANMAELCLEEALTNAMVHGNRHDPTKHIEIVVFGESQKQWGVIIEDEGDGFTLNDIPDPSDPENMLRESGRGILLISHYMDDLKFSSKGNRLRMVRRPQTQPDPGTPIPITADDEEELPPAEPKDLAPINIDDIDQAGYAQEPVELPDEILLSESAIGEYADGPVTFEDCEGGVLMATIHDSRLTERTSEIIRNALLDAVDRDTRLVLDMQNVEFLASIGIGAILTVYKTVTAGSGCLVMTNVMPVLENVLSATGLLRFFTIEHEPEAAIARAAR